MGKEAGLYKKIKPNNLIKPVIRSPLDPYGILEKISKLRNLSSDDVNIDELLPWGTPIPEFRRNQRRPNIFPIIA